jgi:transcriptional regulator with XRE-family HTH domain
MKKPPAADRDVFVQRLWELTKHHRSNAAAADSMEIPHNTFNRWMSGESRPNNEGLRQLSQGLGVSVDFLLGEEAEAPKFTSLSGAAARGSVLLPFSDLGAAAGAGLADETIAAAGYLEFPAWMLERLGVANARLVLMRAEGRSMEPLMRDGALLLVDLAQREPPPDNPPRDALAPKDVYVFVYNDARRVKHLRRTDEALLLLGEQPGDVEVVRGPRRKGLEVVGRVVWWDNLL